MSIEETQAQADQSAAEEEEVTYHAVEKDGVITAIWEMVGKKHRRTIDPNSSEGQQILQAYKPSDKPEE